MDSATISVADDDGILLSDEAALRVFEELRADPEYLWEYIDDCCLARAHKMCAALKARGVLPEKIRVDNADGTWLGSFGLAVAREDAPGGFITMGFHIAPIVRVHTGAGIEERVMDPALFDRPVTVDVWSAKLINRHSIGPDNSIDPALQDKDFTRLAHDVFEKVLYWENRDDDMEKTNKLLERHRQDHARRSAGKENARPGPVLAGRSS